MNVLIAARSFYPNFGGVESSIDYISHSFRERGHNVTILTSLLNEDQALDEEYEKGIRILRIPIKNGGLKNISIIETAVLPHVLMREYEKYISMLNQTYDLVISRDTALTILLVAKYGVQKVIYIPAVVMKNYRWNVKLGTIRHMLGEMIMYSQISLDWRLQKKCLENYRTIVFSKNMKNQILKMLKVRYEPIVVYPGTKYQVNQIDTFKRREGKCKLLYVGRVDTEKNVEFLVRAFSRCNRIDEAELTIVGSGNRLETAKKLAEDLHIKDSIFFAGKQSELENYYNNAHYLVLPTKYEAFGFVMAEAQTLGVPVIGFKNNGKDILVAIDEIITDSKNGFVCEEYSEESLAKAIDKAIIVYHTDKYDEIVKESVKTAQEKFRWDKFVYKILSIM